MPQLLYTIYVHFFITCHMCQQYYFQTPLTTCLFFEVSKRYFLTLRSLAINSRVVPQPHKPTDDVINELTGVERGPLTPAQVAQRFLYPHFVHHLSSWSKEEGLRECILDEGTLAAHPCLQPAISFAPVAVPADQLSQYRCVASDSFFNRERYDHVQIAWDATEKRFARLRRVLRYLPICGAPISIVYAQVYHTVRNSHSLFGSPVVPL